MIGPDGDWKQPPRRLSLGPDDVHVWKVALSAAPGRLSRFLECLSTEERDRAERFHFPRDRRRFIVRHGALRMILSRYLDGEPARLQFAYGSGGKPHLAGMSQDGGLRFNMSDSRDLALIALARSREVGVDLEFVRPVSDFEHIVDRCFSPFEIGVFLSLPPDQRLAAFFNGWTRKEAFIKASGEGLARPLDGFDVSLGPGEPARLIQIRDAPQDATRWRMQALVPAPGMAAALVVEGFDWRLGRYAFDGGNPYSDSEEVDADPNFTRQSIP